MGASEEFERHRLLQAIAVAHPKRQRVLATVAALALPDAWVAAGFVRNAVWDHLHGRPAAMADGDVDVIWFSPGAMVEQDRAIEARLSRTMPGVRWSVKNQARMHARNGDAPYRDCADAMRHWPETATAVGIRLDDSAIQVCAPYGLSDLFDLRLVPTPLFRVARRAIFNQRLRAKWWQENWPHLSVD